ncbi:Rho termination factor N-terminal domain-containing protein [Saccharomonospora sp. NPDC006951]
MRLELQDMTMGELTEEAHRAGIPFVAHMNVQELIEAIEQQQETNALLPSQERGDLTAG